MRGKDGLASFLPRTRPRRVIRFWRDEKPSPGSVESSRNLLVIEIARRDLIPRGTQMTFMRMIAISAVAASIGLPASAGVMATATYTDSQISPGVYEYDLTLDNTGTTTIGTFWFSWIPGAGFMSATPTNITSPSNWSDIPTNGNKSIQ